MPVLLNYQAILKARDGGLTDWLTIRASSWTVAKRTAVIHLIHGPSTVDEYKCILIARAHDFGTMKYSYRPVEYGHDWSEIEIGNIGYILRKL